MYNSFFQLRKKPFELVPDPEFIYLSRSHKKALTYLDYGIRERAGFILLTGDVGSGKTTLIRDLINKKYDRVLLAKIFHTQVNSEQLLAMINEDFGILVKDKDKISLLRHLNDFLLQQYAAGNHPILIIDEAQNLSAELLEEVRMLSNLESEHGKLLQIVLVGQPELRSTLASPELLQLRQRISINCHLKALCREETAEYIVHRMTVAGNAGALEYQPQTLDIIYQHSRGIPRLINIICDFLMLSAYAEQVRQVSDDMVLEVIGDLDFENHFWGTGLPPGVAVSPAGSEAEGAFQDLAQRTETLERELTPVAEGLREIRDALTLFKEELTAQQAKSEAQVAELKQALATVKGTLERIAEPQANPSLMRRLLGGAGPNGN